MEVGKMMDDFDQEENQEQNPVEEKQEENEVQSNAEATEQQEPIETSNNGLKIEDVIEPGRYGVSNSQMIPALKKAIAEQSVEKLALLKKSYYYTYDKSIRYLKKAERDYIANNDI